MAIVCIFTVKVFHQEGGNYFTYGGFGLYLAQMCQSFDQVILICKLRSGPPPEGYYKVEYENLEIVTVPAWRTELGALLVQPLVFLKGLAAVRRSDVVHARMPDWTGITGNLIARCLRVPIFHQIVGDTKGLACTIPLTKAFGLGAGLRIVLLFYDWLERFVSHGEMVFAQGQVCFDKHSQAKQRYLVLSSAHHDDDIGEVRPKCGGNRIDVLAVGRLQTVKNHELLVRAIALLRQEDQRWHLRILGEGPKRLEIEKLACKLGVHDFVCLPGNVEHDESLWRQYDAADMFVLPSVSEGTPKVVLEAMARGCPVVASAVSGVPTAVKHGERGLLFPSGDLPALVAAMRRMATDGNLRQSCQDAALEFAREHTLEQSTRFMLDRVLEEWPQLAPLRHDHA